MPVSLSKGGNVSLSKEAPGLTAVRIGLGWDPRVTDGTEFDLDGSVFLLNDQGKVRGDSDFIFYNNKTSADGSVTHNGDNRSGQGEGDDESVEVKIAGVPADVQRIAFGVTIHEADARRQSFGQVQNAFIRVINAADDKEIARYDLSEDYSTETAMIFGELYRNGADWKFKAIGQGYAGGLAALAGNYGVNVG
ncbi:chemical-damaging agent resistance protein C [Deinococcus sp. HMF7620]|uniref:Chemical-damaging agent resistance protein C n=1 Tax=Deinococcus arboris TaxID=2682977 RepID=A0A7C9LMT0_9DEIO|nr:MULTISPECIES: TerD family protein [Deinococcus]MBZ9749766.1 TerD family protein [Deinococcus betulae]MVN87577.1 chemical-damaging agent resistance protein C [Deinococcus arboris]